ncbi:hypothetical protein ACFV80_30610 [Streptomyces sp. NPDC059862]|uniref:hypothetical protein n=1 Tax=Streptomyces sp. NPDC059862 TaxID=3346975 RepID=UPI00365A2871
MVHSSHLIHRSPPTAARCGTTRGLREAAPELSSARRTRVIPERAESREELADA